MTFVIELKARKEEKEIAVRVFSCTKCQTFNHVNEVSNKLKLP